MLQNELKDILLHIAEELEKIRINEEFWQDVPVQNASHMNTRTMVELYRQYIFWEKDPVYKRIFGEMLRVRIILAVIDGEWRQRQGWEHWFMALYRGNNRWSERAEVLKEDPDPFKVTIYRPDNWVHPYFGLLRDIPTQAQKEEQKREEERKTEVKDNGTN